MSRARDLYTRAIERYNAGDIDGFANTHAVNAVLLTPAGITRGRTAIRDYWLRQRTAFPDLSLRLDAVLEQGNAVAAEWTWTGTQTGPLTLRGTRRVAPSGTRVEIRGMELVPMNEDGKIAEYHLYWDGLAMALQLKIVPDVG